jgi:hypothetical protein
MGLEVFYIRTLVCLFGFVALYALQSQRMQAFAQKEVNLIDEMLHLQHQQYLQSKRNIEVVNRKYHDLRHHIQAIRAESNPTKRAEYLDDLEASISGYATQADTGHRVLDVILTARSQEAAARGIDFTCVVDGGTLDFMTTADLAAIFGNAMDNAFEAVTSVRDPERRVVKCAVHARDQFVIMTFENYFDGIVKRKGEELESRKADHARHGFGLKSMRHSAEKYDGTMTVNVDGNWFVVRILVPIPDDDGARQPALAGAAAR